jgi:hypothetical protein
VIVIGMHRSGTSMLMEMLDGLGLFPGWRLDVNHEATFFIALNQWLLTQSGGAWDRPEAIRSLLGQPAARAKALDVLRDLLASPRSAAYTGVPQWLRGERPMAMRRAWGWKDPRNTFTLPLWLELFPGARVVHVSRHGVDVAQSLRTRALGQLDRLDRKPARYVRWVLPRRIDPSLTLRCLDLEQGLLLWDQYETEAQQHLKALGERAVSLRYEALLADPAPQIERVARHCGLLVSPERITSVTAGLRPERARAHAQDAQLAEFSRDHAALLAKHGY